MELTPERIELLAKRAAEAKVLVDERRIHPMVGFVDPDQYIAIHPKGAWLIRLAGSGPYPWHCSCPDWEYRADETLGHCKHVVAVLLYRDEHPPEVSTVRRPSHIEDLESKVEELYN